METRKLISKLLHAHIECKPQEVINDLANKVASRTYDKNSGETYEEYRSSLGYREIKKVKVKKKVWYN